MIDPDLGDVAAVHLAEKCAVGHHFALRRLFSSAVRAQEHIDQADHQYDEDYIHPHVFRNFLQYPLSSLSMLHFFSNIKPSAAGPGKDRSNTVNQEARRYARRGDGGTAPRSPGRSL
ncbi:hypothetical protein SDC9_121615 [bioreactor metagenome]|uniref:Uncharacterized protein n=1 Tax=bioreactor metagenome TaxID=1076179 RepID=A0A645CCE3_9ZZZZ